MAVFQDCSPQVYESLNAQLSYAFLPEFMSQIRIHTRICSYVIRKFGHRIMFDDGLLEFTPSSLRLAYSSGN